MTAVARYKKAILAVIGGLGPLLAIWGLDLNMNPEQAAGISGGLATLLVLFGPKNAD